MLKSRTLRTAAFSAIALSVAACGMFDATYPDKQAGKTQPSTADDPDGGFFIPFSSLFGGGSKSSSTTQVPLGSAISVNGYLWRASLDTLSFLPMASADPFGGVILTEWYAPPESPNERFKATVTITDRELRADAIHVSVFRQTKSDNGAWVDATVNPRTKVDIENAILTRARELRSANAAIKKE